MRTISEIYDEIILNKDSQTPLQNLAPGADNEQQLLADLNSTSKVSVWRLWAYLIAVAIWTHEALFDLFDTEIDAKAASAITGNSKWYQKVVSAYQNGDLLTFDISLNKYVYPVIDLSKQIVKRVAIVEQPDGSLKIKVAKFDGSTGLLALDSVELTGLSSYIKKIRFAGTRFALISGNGDILRIEADIYHDGAISAAIIAVDVESAINSFISDLPFNGELMIIKLIDKIQAVDGILDVVVLKAETKIDILDNYIEFTRVHQSHFGYYQIDDSLGNKLSDTLNYISQ